jgi:DNA-binding transcriptional LysR family regulator
VVGREGAMNLNLLRSFMAVYRNRSFSKSAEELGLSQPGVTAQIRALEQHLGKPLFKRTPKGAEPLPHAHRLADDVRAELDALEQTWTQHLPGEAEAPRAVYLGGPAEMLGTAVIPALGACLARGVEVHIAHGFPGDLAAGVREGRFDLAITAVVPNYDDLEWTDLFTEEYVLVSAPDYEPVVGMSVEDKAAGRFPESCRFIAYDPRIPVIRWYWSMAFECASEISGSMIVPDLRSVLKAVTAGLGISVLPSYLCECELRRGDLVVLHRPDARPTNPIYLVRSRNRQWTAAVRHVHEALLASAENW